MRPAPPGLRDLLARVEHQHRDLLARVEHQHRDLLAKADADHPRPWAYRQPTWVFTSRELPRVDGAEIRFVRGDVAAVHAAMAEAVAGKNIWIVGGGELAGQFHDRGLLDEVILAVTPVSLGGGAPLLPRGIAEPPMRLTDVRRDGEFALLTYTVRRSAG